MIFGGIYWTERIIWSNISLLKNFKTEERKRYG